MSIQTTVRADHRWDSEQPKFPSGLLRFFPLGSPPAMKFFLLRNSPQEIGRDEACAIYLEDQEASRRHARVIREGEGWLLQDYGSTNGVFVNGTLIDSLTLRGGEVIRVGTTLLKFFQQGVAPDTDTLAVKTADLVAGPAFFEVYLWLDRASGNDLTVLLTGETGTGKEVAARYIHHHGSRSSGPFVPVNCAAIPAELAESELFGHVRGAFSGAGSDARGLVLAAHGGTLFLDEIGELSLNLQAKLLRVLQDRRIRPVGGTREQEVDVRFLCATNQDLSSLVQQGRFREDLLARLAYLEIRLPPLRERVEDIPLLVRHFLTKHGAKSTALSVELAEMLCCQPWPRNVRQLESAVQQALVLADGEELLTPILFPQRPARSPDTPPREEETGQEPVIKDPAAKELDQALRRCEGEVEKAAAHLGISRSQLYRRAKKYGLWVPSYRK